MSNMYNYKILIVDDNENALNSTIQAISNFVDKEHIYYVSNANDAINELKTNQYSIVFLDIELKDTTGFMIADYIEREYKGLSYVFLTGYAQYAIDSYNYNPLDFITKPIDFMRLEKTFHKYKNKDKKEIKKISINTEDGLVYLPIDEILYIEKSSRKNILHTTSNKKYSLNYSMNEIEILLDDCGLFRCHQSFLINLENVREIKTSGFGTSYVAILKNETSIPVSRAKFPILKNKLSQSITVSL